MPSQNKEQLILTDFRSRAGRLLRYNSIQHNAHRAVLLQMRTLVLIKDHQNHQDSPYLEYIDGILKLYN